MYYYRPFFSDTLRVPQVDLPPKKWRQPNPWTSGIQKNLHLRPWPCQCKRKGRGIASVSKYPQREGFHLCSCELSTRVYFLRSLRRDSSW